MKRVASGIVVLAVAGALVWVLRSRDDRDRAATAVVTQASGSASSAPRSREPEVATPARVEITVANAKGPIEGAAVRLAPEDGDVIVVHTGPDGRARADALVPGAYEISASAAGHEPAALRRKLAAGEEVTFALTLVEGGRTLRGTVTDASGGPIEGARIDARRLDAVATTLTAADGTYALTVAEGEQLVSASSPDYARQARYVEVGAAGAIVDFALVPGGVIEGIVRDERTREPVAGAIVTAERERAARMSLLQGAAARTISGADGRFRLTGVSPGTYGLGARAGTRTAKAPTTVGLGVAEQLTGIELLVADGPLVTGVVVDEHEKPVAGAQVVVLGPSDADAEADEDGRFTLVGLPPGDHTLMGEGDGVLPAQLTPVQLADEDVTDVRVKVRRSAKLRGHVEPRQVCGVSVESEASMGLLPVMVPPVTTGDDGAFELGPVAPGAATLHARCPGGDHGSLAVEASVGMAPVVLKVSPGGTIAGRVLDGRKRPVAGVTVTATSSGPVTRTSIVNGQVTDGVQGRTREDGSFELRGLAAGAYALAVLDRGRPLAVTRSPGTLELAAAEAKRGIELVVERPDGVIRGIVIGPDGKPLADAWVTASVDLRAMVEDMVRDMDRSGSRTVTITSTDGEGGASTAPALTDARGQFELVGLAPGAYEVIAEAEAGKIRGRLAAVRPDASVTIQTHALAELSGTVRGPDGPVKAFTVALDGPTQTTRSFTNGTFELGRVEPGMYTLRVTSPEGNAETAVQVVPGQPARVDLVLAANAYVVGTLVGADGKPLAGAPVAVLPQTSGATQVTIEGPPLLSGPDGRFRIEAAPGPSVLAVMLSDAPFLQPGLQVEAGKTLDLGTVRVEPQPDPE